MTTNQRSRPIVFTPYIATIRYEIERDWMIAAPQELHETEVAALLRSLAAQPESLEHVRTEELLKDTDFLRRSGLTQLDVIQSVKIHVSEGRTTGKLVKLDDADLDA